MNFEDHLRDDLQGVGVPSLPQADLADAALLRARRQSRTRTLAAAGGLVVVLGAGAATVPAWLPGQGGGGTSPGSLSCTTGAPPPLTASPTWASFDPLRYEIDTSGVTGYTLTAAATSRYFQTAALADPDGEREVTVTLYAQDGEPHYRTDDALPFAIDPATGAAAEPVNGSPAYWLPEQTYAGLPQEQGLAWQWSPDAWVFVTASASSAGAATPEASTVDHDELRALAASVAPQLAFGHGAPVTSPFAVPVPSCTRVVATHLLHATAAGDVPFTRFGLVFGPSDYVDPTNPLLIPDGGGQPITIDADTYATPADKPGAATSTVDGHPAAEVGAFLTVYDVDGLAIELTAPPAVDKATLFRTVSVYSENPSGWGPPVMG